MLDVFVRNRIAEGNAFFHFTDERNLDSIRTHGLLSLRELKRRTISIAAPGGNEWSWTEDERRGLDDYVHLCFRNDHPMQYVAAKDGRIGNSRYLTISPNVALIPGVRFSFDVANKSGVPNYPITEAIQLPDFDSEVLYSWCDWKKPEVQLRLRTASKYELLVPKHVPCSMIGNL